MAVALAADLARRDAQRPVLDLGRSQSDRPRRFPRGASQHGKRGLEVRNVGDVFAQRLRHRPDPKKGPFGITANTPAKAAAPPLRTVARRSIERRNAPFV